MVNSRMTFLFLHSPLRVSNDRRYMTITAQLEDLDARETLRGILHCFTQLRIRVLIDFFFMMHSKTR